jgi:hypothetical protein
MQEEVASFLAFQIRRATEKGDTEQAMAQMRTFLELEREAKNPERSGAVRMQVRKLSGLRAIK